MSFELPPIVKLAERVLADVERAVRGFSRYNKYSVGEKLRGYAFSVTEFALLAWRQQHNAHWIEELDLAIERLKIGLQLAKEVQAFRSFAEFEALARLITDLGRQCGGWKQSRQRKGQNRRTHETSAGRAQTLSARGASAAAEASP